MTQFLLNPVVIKNLQFYPFATNKSSKNCLLKTQKGCRVCTKKSYNNYSKKQKSKTFLKDLHLKFFLKCTFLKTCLSYNALNYFFVSRTPMSNRCKRVASAMRQRTKKVSPVITSQPNVLYMVYLYCTKNAVFCFG